MGVAHGHDHAAAALHHGAADLDPVAAQLGGREPARPVAAPLADQAGCRRPGRWPTRPRWRPGRRRRGGSPRACRRPGPAGASGSTTTSRMRSPRCRWRATWSRRGGTRAACRHHHPRPRREARAVRYGAPVTPAPPGVVVSEPVARALRDGDPLVALESTIITHGLPRPENVAAAREFEQAVADRGAVPATIAVLDGVPHVGLEVAGARAAGGQRGGAEAQRPRPSGGHGPEHRPAARPSPRPRCSPRRPASACSPPAGSAACIATPARPSTSRRTSASSGRCRITVVSAGVKSILDIAATLERLETLSVPVLVFGTDRVPRVLADRQRLHRRPRGHHGARRSPT